MSRKACRMRVLPALLAVWAVVLLCGSARADEGDAADRRAALSAFGALPVLHGGRVMPMDSYAHVALMRLSGRRHVAGEPSIAWLLRVLCQPETTRDDAIFLVDDPEIADALGMPEAPRRRYTYRAVRDGFLREDVNRLLGHAFHRADADRTRFEKGLLRLYDSRLQYERLSASLSYTLPHPDFALEPHVAVKLGFPGDGVDLGALDVLRNLERLRSAFMASHHKGVDAMDETERAAFRLAAGLFARNRFYEPLSLPFSVIPLGQEESARWLAPWQALVQSELGGAALAELEALVAMREAHVRADWAAVGRATEAFRLATHTRMGGPPPTRQAELERGVHRLRPLYHAKWLLLAGFLVAALSQGFWTRPLERAGGVALAAAFLLVTFALLARMAIMGRPPVTNLYASFLFVGWICMLLGLVLWRGTHRAVGLLQGTLCGVALLFIASRYESDGDTMGVLVAVLDSNFWLSTHVVTITMGYGGCLAAGAVGHLYLLQALLQPGRAGRLAQAYRVLVGMLGFGLIFSFIGTVLGGVWADQSWGRFWGWDPKENGALLIVLWCAILFHARLGGMVRDLGMAAGAILGIPVVLFAWFGVNLLGTGLHSYGFTSGAATGLFAFGLFEVIFVAALVPAIGRRRGGGRLASPDGEC